jgi:hypothetical protein
MEGHGIAPKGRFTCCNLVHLVHSLLARIQKTTHPFDFYLFCREERPFPSTRETRDGRLDYYPLLAHSSASSRESSRTDGFAMSLECQPTAISRLRPFFRFVACFNHGRLLFTLVLSPQRLVMTACRDLLRLLIGVGICRSTSALRCRA